MSGVEDYMVFGYWADSDERFSTLLAAASAREAEEIMQARAHEEGGDFRAAATLFGEHFSADRYTAFIDPDDPRNLDRDDLEPVYEELQVTEYTVIGLVRSATGQAWNERTGGERFLGRELATSPRYAEDNARLTVRDRAGLELIVCAVLEGRKNRCEALPFSNPDERVAD